ncbi:MAG TPA: amino acid permease [Gemmatimonadaceae bacterium]|nr:amino acid permease [Gemmatimonadaceae bacterium]
MSDTTSTSTGYARRLGLFDAAMVTAGGIIGGGIFLNPSVVAQRVPTSTLIVIVWVLGGAIAATGAFCFAELGGRRPEAGGGYVYLKEAFGPLPAFLYGWTFLVVINTGGMAAVAVTFAHYSADLVHLPASAERPIAIGTVLLLTIVNVRGIRAGATTQNIFTILKLVALAAVIVAGVALGLGYHGAGPAPTTASAPVVTGDLVRIIGVALVPILFAYGGWAHANNVGGEVKDPERTLPRAMLVGMAIVIVVYLLANVAYLAALGRDGLAVSRAPATDTLRRAVGPLGGTLVGLGIAFSTFGFVNITILSAPRILQTMAADGLFFQRAAVLHPRFRTPAVALWWQAVWGVVLTASGSYGALLDYVVFGDWLFFASIAATLFVYRRRERETGVKYAGFRVPGYPVVPLIFIVVAGYVMVSSIRSGPRNALIGAGLIALGVPVFLLWRRSRTPVSQTAPP